MERIQERPVARVKPAVRIRWMLRRDEDEVLDIESVCFLNAAWTRAEFDRSLHQRNCFAMVAELSATDELAGFMVYRLIETRIDLLTMAVKPSCWRNGIGTAMIGKLKSKMKVNHKRSRIIAKVAERNLEGHLFFAACGFRAISIMRTYFDDGQDAYVFEFRNHT